MLTCCRGFSALPGALLDAVWVSGRRNGKPFWRTGKPFWQSTLPVLVLFWAHAVWHFYLFAVLIGIGLGGEMSAFPIINRQY